MWGGGCCFFILYFGFCLFACLFVVLVSVGHYWGWGSVCDVGFVSVCFWGLDGLRARFNVNFCRFISQFPPVLRFGGISRGVGSWPGRLLCAVLAGFVG